MYFTYQGDFHHTEPQLGVRRDRVSGHYGGHVCFLSAFSPNGFSLLVPPPLLSLGSRDLAAGSQTKKTGTELKGKEQ